MCLSGLKTAGARVPGLVKGRMTGLKIDNTDDDFDGADDDCDDEDDDGGDGDDAGRDPLPACRDATVSAVSFMLPAG